LEGPLALPERKLSTDHAAGVSLDTFQGCLHPVCMGSKSSKPVHPGKILRHEILETFELSVREAAAALGVTRPAFSALLNGRASLSPEMAIRIEKAFGLEMGRLLHLQTDWDVAQAKSRAREIHVLAYRPGQRARTYFYDQFVSGGIFLLKLDNGR
jgi:addiction module HigA family antidote